MAGRSGREDQCPHSRTYPSIHPSFPVSFISNPALPQPSPLPGRNPQGLLFLTYLPTTLLVLLVAVALAVRARSPPEAVLAALVALFILAFDTLAVQHLRASLCVGTHHLRAVLLATEDDDARELRAKAAAAAGGQQAAAAVVGSAVGRADGEPTASDSTVGDAAIAHVGIELRPTAYGLAVVHWRWLLVGLAAMVQGAGLALGGYALYRIYQY